MELFALEEGACIVACKYVEMCVCRENRSLITLHRDTSHPTYTDTCCVGVAACVGVALALFWYSATAFRQRIASRDHTSALSSGDDAATERPCPACEPVDRPAAAPGRLPTRDCSRDHRCPAMWSASDRAAAALCDSALLTDTRAASTPVFAQPAAANDC